MLSVVFWHASVFTCCEVSKRPSLQSFTVFAGVLCDVVGVCSHTPESVEQVEHKEVMAAFARLLTTTMNTRNNEEADCNKADESDADADIPGLRYRLSDMRTLLMRSHAADSQDGPTQNEYMLHQNIALVHRVVDNNCLVYFKNVFGNMYLEVVCRCPNGAFVQLVTI